MPDDPSIATVHALAIQEMLNLPKLYGPHGFASFLSSSAGGANGSNGGPPAGLVAALERLETATVDPALLSDGQTVASVEAQTIADLGRLANDTRIELGGAATAIPLTPARSMFYGSIARDFATTRLPADAELFTPAAAKPPVTVTGPPPPPASGAEQFLVTNLTTGVSDWEEGQFYDGPVAGLRNQFVTLTADNVNITATKGSNFIHAGSGNNAIDLSLFALEGGTGTNVVDCGAGSSFIKLYNYGVFIGKGADTVLIDTRAAVADTWSTVSGFYQGDAVTIYGVTPGATTLDWEDNQGAAGATGLTLHAMEQGKPIASLTLAGYSRTDLGNGRLGVSFGNDPASGSSYLSIRATAA